MKKKAGGGLIRVGGGEGVRVVVNEELKLLRKCQKWLGEGPVGGGGGGGKS